MLKGLQTWLILLVNTVQDFSSIYVCVYPVFSGFISAQMYGVTF